MEQMLCPTCKQPLPRNARLSLGARLHIIRNQRGMTLQELGEALNCTGPHLAMIESGLRNMSLAMFISAARSLGVSLDELAGFTREED
ncbi:MAG: helix-turn-helix domain-containing protein [Anaerolineae bacterium]|jgi:transcriptional regulator with XRE-family HTH domain